MVADLVRASAAEISLFRFPSGDKGQVRGFDGRLQSGGAPPFVPAGESIWEFGVGEGAAKANRDYFKRVGELSTEDRAKTTFVFVTLQTWDNPRQKLEGWVREKQDQEEWKDVRYIDGMALEHWLDSCPAVAARYARFELGLAPHVGARSLDEFWREYSFRYEPQLTEAVLLCERHEQAQELLSKLLGPASRVVILQTHPMRWSLSL